MYARKINKIIIFYMFSELGPWSPWSDCPVTCGGGRRNRERECGLGGQSGGGSASSSSSSSSDNPCFAVLFESEDCNSDKCPVFGAWSEWTECSKTCGAGDQYRDRQCRPYGTRLFCQGETDENRLVEEEKKTTEHFTTLEPPNPSMDISQ